MYTLTFTNFFPNSLHEILFSGSTGCYTLSLIFCPFGDGWTLMESDVKQLIVLKVIIKSEITVLQKILKNSLLNFGV